MHEYSVQAKEELAQTDSFPPSVGSSPFVIRHGEGQQTVSTQIQVHGSSAQQCILGTVHNMLPV